MIHINTQTHTIQTSDHFKLHIQTYLSKQSPKGVIVYYHGGGLIAGLPHDLPDEVIEILTQHFHLVEAPYRLAPESNIDTIFNDAFLVFDSINERYPDLPIFTFGRSSGGYLALQIASKRTVKGVIDFYGYVQINLSEFKLPHQAFQKKTAHLNSTMIDMMIQSQATTEGPIQFRYPLYLYTRGQGNWYAFVGIQNAESPKLNLTPHELNQLPPIFIAHASKDIDVPFSESERLAQHVPHSTLVTIDSDEHDFDRKFNTQTQAIYLRAEQFLHRCLTH
ncbi:alpha/beta hydrolase [Staphylococcus simulans]